MIHVGVEVEKNSRNATDSNDMISFVYFDLGGVLDIDFSVGNGWDDLRNELGIRESQKEPFDNLFASYEREICTNRDIETMLPILQKKFGITIPKDYSLLDAFVKRFRKNESIWPVLSTITKYCRVGILTMMYQGMFDAIRKENILPSNAWDVIVDSSNVGFTKYDKEFFEFAQKQANVAGDQILFVENSKKHVQMAPQFGWQTFWYDTSNPMLSSRKLLKFFEESK